MVTMFSSLISDLSSLLSLFDLLPPRDVLHRRANREQKNRQGPEIYPLPCQCPGEAAAAAADTRNKAQGPCGVRMRPVGQRHHHPANRSGPEQIHSGGRVRQNIVRLACSSRQHNRLQRRPHRPKRRGQASRQMPLLIRCCDN